MHRQDALSSSLQMYLKAILQLQTEHRVARVKEISEKLGVTGATVSSAIKNLEERGLVNHARYGYVTLTTTGEALADCVLNRYQVLRNFMTGVLAIDEETADADACLMEHDISVKTMERLEAFIEYVNREGVSERFATYLKSRDAGLADALCNECSEAGACKMIGKE